MEFADTDAVFESPQHSYTQKLIGAIPTPPRFRVVPVRRASPAALQGVA